MRVRFISLNKSKYILLIIYVILLFSTTIGVLELNYKETIIESKVIVSQMPKTTKEENNKVESRTLTINKLKEYENMPTNIDGYKVIGKLEIPKIELITYILEETTKDSLNKSVTKLTRSNNKSRRKFLYNRT